MDSVRREIDYRAMRVIIGSIAILLAPFVYIFSGHGELTSISMSYWTDARDIFVGSLIVVGFFLSAYNGEGYKRDWEFYISKVACVLAVCVALFPTAGCSALNVAPVWTVKLSGFFGLRPQHIHYGSAILLFACLIAMMWFFSSRALCKGKRGRAYFYRIIAILMAVGILSLLYMGYLLNWKNTVLYVEILGLSLFGVGWLAAGTYKVDPIVAPCVAN